MVAIVAVKAIHVLKTNATAKAIQIVGSLPTSAAQWREEETKTKTRRNSLMSPKQKEEKWRQKRREHETNGLPLHPLLSPTVSWSCGLEFESSLSESIVAGKRRWRRIVSNLAEGRNDPPPHLDTDPTVEGRHGFKAVPFRSSSFLANFYRLVSHILLSPRCPWQESFSSCQKRKALRFKRRCLLKIGKHVFSHHRNCLTHCFA